MEFTLQPYRSARAAGTRPTPPRHSRTELSNATSLACIMGFREARERLLAQFEPAAADFAPAPQARPTLECRAGCHTRWVHPLETSLYWLLSAATLSGVLLGVLSL
jgi:hypothetical protein